MTEAALNPAETYERYMVPALFMPAAERLLDVVRPRPGERVLDVGSGTGIVARRVALRVRPHGPVTGFDLSPDMLAVARATAKQAGLAIDWQEGRAEAVPFPDESFDLVLSQFALMFFTDRAKALAEMRRVLHPGGRAGITVMQGITRHPFYQALDAAISSRLGISPVAAIFSLGAASTLRELLQEAGFRDLSIEATTIDARFPNPEAFLAGEIDVDTAAIPAMQRLDLDERRELTAAIQSEMAEPLRAVTVGDHVHLPFHVHIAQGVR
jgi:ubiquinone/menaquinone biosynthesis C-methylase UbiE